MPTIGRPNIPGSNSFNNIKMADKRKPTSERDPKKIGDELNRVAGREAESIVQKGPHNQIGKDEFLKLLSHQLQNQDPGNPMDQKRFAADLAQFSQLEQLTNMRTELKKVHESAPMQKKAIAASFIGKQVFTGGSSIRHLGGGKPSEIQFSLPRQVEKVIVRVLDQQGNTVSEIQRDSMSAGLHSLNWDGVQADKTLAPKGEYRLMVNAWDESMTPVKVKTQTSGVVDSVSFNNGYTILHVDGKKISLNDVVSFKSADEIKPAQLKNSLPTGNQPAQNNSPLAKKMVQRFKQ